jgi:diaminohydroxyphosphoribosylaminopyrimidine deaminase/5-amino-6-(5-phosphoribosylamino)uracil reductase
VIAVGGAIVGEGATADGGRPHAEERALAQAGDSARGATAYVTLEPCAHRSNGGVSCSDLLIQAHIVRVVIAARDPHPMAAGVGIERLRAAGIAVEIGLAEADSRAQNADFFAKWEKV